MEIKSANEVKQLHLKTYIRYLQERGKYTVVVNENTKKTNNPEKRTDYKGTVTNITINNYMRNIKVFFNYMFSEKLIRTNPVDGIKKLNVNVNTKMYNFSNYQSEGKSDLHNFYDSLNYNIYIST